MIRDLEIRAHIEPWNDRVALQVRGRQEHNGPFHYGTEIIMEPVAENTEKPVTCVLSIEAAQSLMDQLWQCGLRPSEGSGSAGALRAVEAHRDDLRKLLFHKEGIA